jgi:NAD+ diphosphatase
MHTPAGFLPAHGTPGELPPGTLAFAYRDTQLLVVGQEPTAAIPTLATLAEAGLAGPSHYLGVLDGTPCVAVALEAAAPAPPDLRYAGLRSLFFVLPEPLLAIAARAFQVADWERSHRYCGRCGTPTRDKPGERAKECPACGHLAWPRDSPAMMVLVTRGRELLLARAHRFAPGMYSALAGFVEPGETIEDCIRREVREEVGIEVDGIAYFGSQSWAFPHSLMIAYTATYAGGLLRADDDEIADVRWFAPEALPKLPPSVSIARRLIEATRERLLAA